ncbi:MAG: hypothetical protein PUA82_07875 [Eubacteriales bacterium]|nr:hypothetical protein [Eubacteriales bacterium]
MKKDERVFAAEEMGKSRRGRRKAYIFDDSCSICGSRHVESGRIFHGHCVCEECLTFITNMPAAGSEDDGSADDGM